MAFIEQCEGGKLFLQGVEEVIVPVEGWLHHIANGDQHHRYVRDERLIESVLNRIAVEGPLMAKEFEDAGKKGGWKPGAWSSKPAKRALETLFMKGDLMVHGRQNFHKIYDLPQRVLPADADTTPPTSAEHSRCLVTRFLGTNGIGRTAEIAYLLKNVKPLPL